MHHEVGASYGVFGHIPVAAEQLHALVAALFSADDNIGSRGPPFRHRRRFLWCKRSRVQLLDTAINEDTGDLDLRLHLGKLEARILKTARIGPCDPFLILQSEVHHFAIAAVSVVSKRWSRSTGCDTAINEDTGDLDLRLHLGIALKREFLNSARCQ